MEQQVMTYEEARKYLKHTEKKGIVLGLTVMEDLLHRLGNPEEGLRVVHIAGTNGKGSILAYMEQILLTSGYHTGRYVSPAIGIYEGRFLIDGKPMNRDWVSIFVSQIKKAVDKMEQEGRPLPTVFEIETAMAFLAFQKAKVSVALLETGMGGRLDATNIIKKPLLSMIASISMDHMAALGDTIEAIAREKAGIVKEGCDTLLYPLNPAEAIKVIQNECEQKKSILHTINPGLIRVIRAGEDGSSFAFSRYSKLSIRLPGIHQIYNAVTAVEGIQILKKWFCISEFQVEEGLRRTSWGARLEKISNQPLIYLDGAHNPGGADSLADFIREQFHGRRILGVMGVLADKDYDGIAGRVLPLMEKAATITPDNPRALDGRRLRNTALKYCPDVVFAGSPKDGIEWAKKEASDEDVIIVFGSLSFMNEIGGAYGTVSEDCTA